MNLKRTFASSGLAALMATAAIGVGGPAMAAEPTGTILLANTATAVPGSYIVVLKDRTASTVKTRAAKLAGKYDGSVKDVYSSVLYGFASKMSESAAKRLAADPGVAYVEQDQVFTIQGTQTGATWGLDRIDQASLPLNSTYTYPNTAANVTAYVIDTGILTTHNDFGGRATSGYDFVDNDSNATDCNGHGTHVAGTVGGTTYGVAKAVRLVGVRVLSCSGSGTNAGVISGVNWVTQNAVKPAVANMSLGGGVSTALDNAVANSVASGVTYALAAGNSTANACNSSPSRVASAITVGATTNTDAKASYSNYGTCLDIFAPGSSITSAWYTSASATNTISGTSMASPHVAGVAALVLSANPSYTPAQVASYLTSTAVSNKVTSPGTGSPNRLLQVVNSGTPPTDPPPTDPPTTGCTGTTNTPVAIPDAGAAVTSAITIAGCARNASATSTVAVNISHSYRGDLVIALVAPDGSAYTLKNSSSSDSADNVITTYTANVSGEAANGTWRLRVQDVYRADTGTINTWTLTV